MTVTVISIIALIALAIAASLHAKKGGGGEANAPSAAVADCSSCSGTNARCEQECMMEAATKPIEYYDDEELDAFSGRPSNGYEPEEVEQFAYVMQTMRPDEVAGWCRSLNLRGISLPNELKDEAIMIIGDEHT